MLQALNKKYFRFALSITVALTVLLIGSHDTNAASLLFAPSSSKISVGNIVSVKIAVNSDGVAVNNADAVIRFPTDLLEVMSISKSTSIFSLWVEEPKFSNISGTIELNGGVPTPGYTGQGGEILTVVFKAKKQGTATVVFSEGSVRANDGFGTDVLSSKQPASILINSAAQLEVPAIDTSSNTLPLAPLVTSSSHPQQNQWYQGTTATLSWTVPKDINSIQTLLSKNTSAIPTVTYDSSVSQRTVNNLTDGVLYFHIRYHNSVGWGPITHYKIQIDSTPPLKFTPNVRIENALSVVTLNAVDEMSGVDSYSIKIDETPAFVVKKDSLVNNEYTLPTENQGEHRLTVVAYDKAGNHTESSAVFTSPVIQAPSISVIPDEIKRGDDITVNGESVYPNTDVLVNVQTEDGIVKTYSTKTSSKGAFSIKTEGLIKSGLSEVSAQLVFYETVKSPVSNKVKVRVNDSAVVRASKSTIYVLSFVVPSFILLLALLFMTYLGWHKFFGLKKRISRDVQGTVNEIHKSLMTFKDELENQLDKLEKIREDRDLNKKEEKIFKDLEKNIDGIDEFIEKKLKKVK